MSQDYWLQSFINENNIRDDCWQNAKASSTLFLDRCFNNDKCFLLLLLLLLLAFLWLSNSDDDNDGSEIYFQDHDTFQKHAKAF